MKYLRVQIILFLLSVIFVYYFSTLEYFVPYNDELVLNWYNIVIVSIVIFLFIESLVGIIIYTYFKLKAYGRNEWPPYYVSLKWGLVSGITTLALLFLNSFNFLTLPWGIAIVIIVVIGVLLFR